MASADKSLSLKWSTGAEWLGRPLAPPVTLSTGIAAVDRVIRGFPRGAITEIVGPETSGRTTLLHSVLASATANMEVCAYVDTSDTFDPLSAAQTGIRLSRLIWIRCRNNIDHSLKVVDYLLHAGGFGVIALDLGRVSNPVSRRIQTSYWYRFRRAIENTPTLLVVIEREPVAKSCATLRLEMKRKGTVWSGAPGFSLLKEMQVEAASQKPARETRALMRARAII